MFALMDSIPDIDIHAGTILDPAKFRGELRVEAVEFAYQMRPDNQARFQPVKIHAAGTPECSIPASDLQ